MHTDKEIKNWVCQHIDELLHEYVQGEKNEFSAVIEIPDEEGEKHPYTVFLEFSDIAEENEWVVRNIVRPEQLQ